MEECKTDCGFNQISRVYHVALLNNGSCELSYINFKRFLLNSCHTRDMHEEEFPSSSLLLCNECLVQEERYLECHTNDGECSMQEEGYIEC